MRGVRLDVHVMSLSGDADAVAARLEEHFGMPKAAARRFLSSLPRVAKHQADPEEARAYRRVLSELGAEVELRTATDALPSSSLLDDLPSLPVPAHGPRGATPSMQSFASSARLADAVPRAPAIPRDLVPDLDRSALSRREVEAAMSSPAPQANEDSLGAHIDFRGLSSRPDAESASQDAALGFPSGMSTTPSDAHDNTSTHHRNASGDDAGAAPGERQGPSWAVFAAILLAAGLALGALLSR